EKGSFVLGQNQYKAVILPVVETIPPDIYSKLEEFARSGGVVAATRLKPRASPGFLAKPADHDQIKAITQRLFEDSNAPGHFLADEVALVSGMQRWVPPDVTWSSVTGVLGFVHRKSSDAEIYFIANTSNTGRDVTARINAKGLRGEWWDPLT